MLGNTLAHPYTTQVFAFWLSILPVIGIAALMAAALIRGDRGYTRMQHVRARK